MFALCYGIAFTTFLVKVFHFAHSYTFNAASLFPSLCEHGSSKQIMLNEVQKLKGTKICHLYVLNYTGLFSMVTSNTNFVLLGEKKATAGQSVSSSVPGFHKKVLWTFLYVLVPSLFVCVLGPHTCSLSCRIITLPLSFDP